MAITQEHDTTQDWRAQNTLTVEQAAGVLGIGRASAYAAAGTGDLPVIRLGRRLLVPVGQLRRMLGETQNDHEGPDKAPVGKVGNGSARPAP